MLLCTGNPYSSLSVRSVYTQVPPTSFAFSNTVIEKRCGYRPRCLAQHSPDAPAPTTATFSIIEFTHLPVAHTHSVPHNNSHRGGRGSGRRHKNSRTPWFWLGHWASPYSTKNLLLVLHAVPSYNTREKKERVYRDGVKSEETRMAW